MMIVPIDANERKADIAGNFLPAQNFRRSLLATRSREERTFSGGGDSVAPVQGFGCRP